MPAEQIILIVIAVALVLVLVVMPIFTNKKRQNSINTLYSSLKVGDRIMTIGGIIGTVISINSTSPVDKEIIIETGIAPNKTTLVLDIKALYQVIPVINPAMTVVEPVQTVASEEAAEEVKEDTSDKKDV